MADQPSAGVRHQIEKWLERGAEPVEIDAGHATSRDVLRSVWDLYAEGSLPGGAMWVCGLLPPAVALGRLWFRVRAQQAVVSAGFAGLADACLQALDHRPGPAVVVVDRAAAPTQWQQWRTVGSVCTIFVGGGKLDPTIYPQSEISEDLETNLKNLASLAELESAAGEGFVELRMELSRLYREFGAPEDALRLLGRCGQLEGTADQYLAFERGRCLAQLGRWRDAGRELARSTKGGAPDEHSVAVEIDWLLVDCYSLDGRWADAIAMARQVVRGQAELSDLDSVWTAVALDRLGCLYTTVDNAREAEQSHRAAVAILEDLAESGTAVEVRERWYDALEASLTSVRQR